MATISESDFKAWLGVSAAGGTLPLQPMVEKALVALHGASPIYDVDVLDEASKLQKGKMDDAVKIWITYLADGFTITGETKLKSHDLVLERWLRARFELEDVGLDEASKKVLTKQAKADLEAQGLADLGASLSQRCACGSRAAGQRR